MSSPSSYVMVLEDDDEDEDKGHGQRQGDSGTGWVATPVAAALALAQDVDQRHDPEAQRQVDAARAWVQADPDRRKPRFFGFGRGGALVDPLVCGPRRCDEVFDCAPEFVPRDTRLAGDHATEAAVRRVKQIPSLERLFARRTLERLASLEKSRSVDDTLTARDRSRISEQLRRIQTSGKPMWENWVRMERPRLHHVFDRVVKDWLGGPVDLAEEHLFVSGWEKVPFATLAAAQYFLAAPKALIRFLGIELAKTDGFALRAAFLRATAEQANERSERVGCGIRFQPRA